MNRVTILDPQKDLRWDKFVESHPFGQIYHLSAWKSVLEDSFKHIKGYYFALLDETGARIEAGLPVFSVTSWLTGTRLVSAPFATLYDPLVSSVAQFDLLLKELLRIREDQKFDFLEIRTFQSERFVKNAGLGESRFYKHHFLNLDSPSDVLKHKFHRTCVRQRIARAEKCLVEVKVSQDESDLKDFYGLLMKTRKRRSLPAPPYYFFKSLWDRYFPLNRLTVLLAQKNGHSLAAVMLLMYKDRVSVEYAASDDNFNQLSPIHFIFWRAIRFASETGYKIFDFGRTSSNNTSLMDFKERWGTQTLDIAHFYYPEKVAHDIERKEKSWKYGLVRSIFSLEGFSPFHKALGAFCYRHMG